MRYERRLSREFIHHLNALHDDKESWWHMIIEDDQSFILIRNDRVRILVYGYPLVELKWTFGDLRINYVHVSFRGRLASQPYLADVNRSTQTKNEFLQSIVKDYDETKRTVELFATYEKQVAHSLALRNGQFLDQQVEFKGDPGTEVLRTKPQLIDLTAISDTGALVFFEAKLFKNGDLRSGSLITQLKKYQNSLMESRSKIETDYRDQLEIYAKLKGQFFKTRTRVFDKIRLYPNVRLIITEFDENHEKSLLLEILKGIKAGMGWNGDTDDVIAVGSPQKITMEVLFKGIP
jgi:hypothetical protein